MVGLLLVSHGTIAESLLEVSSKILGKVEGVRAVCLTDITDEEKIMKAIEKARRELDQGEGILVLTDMFGGTPSNLCFSLLEDEKIEVLTGMNLPMILKILSFSERSDLGKLARVAMDCGRENIYLAREILEQRR